MKIEKIDHIHFAVNDIEKFRENFTRLLGLDFTPVQEFPKVEQIASISTNPVEFALIKSTSQDSGLSKFIQDHGEGLHSFCLKVSDFDDIVADFEARGIRYRIWAETKRFGKEVRILHIDPKEANGVLIELMEY